jgi:hypothetical protein
MCSVVRLVIVERLIRFEKSVKTLFAAAFVLCHVIQRTFLPEELKSALWNILSNWL